MKNEFFNSLKHIVMGCIVLMLLLASCVDGFKDNETFISDVRDAQLESPDPDLVTISTVSDASGVEMLEIEWPVIYGAGGYQFTLYNVDDPDNPVAVGEENEVVDGCSVQREKQEDTKYLIVIKTLGSEKYNNAEALESTRISYSTLVPLYATIPSGTDLGEYFTENPVQPLAEGETEIAYELEAGGEYTLTSNVSFGLTTLTLRGSKVNHAKITMGSSYFISDGAGLKFKFIDFDCSSFTADAVLRFNSTLNSEKVSNSWVTVIDPVGFQSCTVTGLAKKLVYDSGVKYGLQTLYIKDCVIEQNTSSNMQLLHFSGGFVKDTQLTTSTFYNKQSNAGYWIQYGSNRITANSEWANAPYLWVSASVLVNKCTFYQIVKTNQIANYAGLAQKGNYLTVTNSIFVDTGSQNVIRRFGGGGSNFTRTFGYNSYWFDGAFASAELTTTPKDDSGTHFESDPMLKDPANGDFTVQGSDQITARTGDPRWLPEE